MHKRGRSRKHTWIEFKNIEDDTSPGARYLRWASVNNPALAQCAYFGCPRCAGKSFRLRHDKKFEIIRFYCPSCGFETSFHIISPKLSFTTIEVYNKQGLLKNVKTVDDYHEKTVRENADSRVLIAEQRLDLGGEWFDGVSGTNSQSRYLTREEVLKRMEERQMKKLMEAALEEIEREQQDDHVAAFEGDIQEGNVDD
jgi:transcription elongation factor Elf1